MIIIDKAEGLTPLQALDQLREKHLEYRDAVLSYAGRLDPMASGLLLVLVGEENKKKEEFLGVDKEYIFEVLFGIETDTQDILGKVGVVTLEKFSGLEPQSFVGNFEQKYPAFSSKTVCGIQLHRHARAGTIRDIEIPTKSVTVHSLQELERREIGGKELLDEVLARIIKVSGDFRQKEIQERWEDTLRGHQESLFACIRFKALVSSGTYIRSLAERMGNSIGLPALAYSIRRTRVGSFTLKDSFRS